ncbi:MAG: riboflavin synthase [Ferrovibrio sp.]|uniref:riboflavin synthase n=1 Tax=Ferrovibrio sp. TaxID=1917215 RepID=UPI00263624D3|nr:riboflavin synthase [Ferrovibrio sp.]MCW0232701.1 riboflavin synthase [Ferrovibrio sp.]
MFTGIITDIGSVVARETRGDTHFRIRTRYETASIDIGASIACAGVCLTVVQKGADWFAVDVSAETLSRSTLGNWKEGTTINLERSLKVGDELGGHIVSGHVDGVGEVVSTKAEGESLRIDFRAPAGLAGFIAEKGSITVDGASLTVNGIDGVVFGVNLIPHTQQVTTLGKLKAEDRVNLEIDVLARYVARLQQWSKPS